MLNKKILLKNFIKKIKFKKKKFILLSLIIILSISLCAFLNSIKNSSISLNNFYNEDNLMDIKLSSSNGFLKNDYESLKSIENINGIMLTKALNVNAKSLKDNFNIKVININNDRSKNNNDYINRLILISGRYPRGINEGLIQESFLKKNNLNLGDLITLEPSNKNDLKAKKIKIVGTIKNEYEENKIPYMYIEERNFGYDKYDEIYITLNNKNNIKFYKDAINNLMFPILTKRYDENKLLIENNIKSLEDSLNSYYTLSYPESSLNELIDQTTKNLQYEKNELEKLKKPEIKFESKNQIASYKVLKEKTDEIKNASSKLPLIILITILISVSILIINDINDNKDDINTLKKLGYRNINIYLSYILPIILLNIFGCLISMLFFYITCIIFKITISVPNINIIFNFKYFIFIYLFLTIWIIITIILKFLLMDKFKFLNKSKKLLLENKLNFSNKIILKYIKQNKLSFLSIIVIINLFNLILMKICNISNKLSSITYFLLIHIIIIYIMVLYLLSSIFINDLKNNILTIKKLGFYNYEIIKFIIKRIFIIIIISLSISFLLLILS